jgi:DMSO reductase family type II enzyme iron-sulfur subunit
MRQLAMVFDLNKCLGCQTCTAACKTQWTNRTGRDYMYWNNVETKPGKGYPKDWENKGGGFKDNTLQLSSQLPSLKDYGIPWEYNLKDVLLEGKNEQVKPLYKGKEVKPEWGANWDEDQGDGIFPNSYYFYLPRICNHCSNPACLAACPRNAIGKREEDGIVLVDQKKCRGYRHCVRACPYKKVYFNTTINRSEKCIFCFPRVEKGNSPACARQCVGRIRHVGYIDDENSHVYKLARQWKVALPLRPDFGTQPNVYYIPPLSPPKFNEEGEVSDEPRIPIGFLKKLFGPEVDNALKTLQSEMEKNSKGEKSELIDILIAYIHKEMFSLFKQGV